MIKRYVILRPAEDNPNTVVAESLTYCAHVVPDAPPNQLAAMQRAFLSGAMWIVAELERCADIEDEAECEAATQKLYHFCQELGPMVIEAIRLEARENNQPTEDTEQ